MKILIDMNLTPRWVHYLEHAGFSAVHWSSVGPVDAPDVELMEYCKSEYAILLTSDLDFGSILAANKGGKPSVIQIRSNDNRPETIGAFLVATITQLSAELESGTLLTVKPGNARVQILPLRYKTN